jgi:hypothetical protein
MRAVAVEDVIQMVLRGLVLQVQEVVELVPLLLLEETEQQTRAGAVVAVHQGQMVVQVALVSLLSQQL